MNDVARIPLFPLHTVLYPGGRLGLRIFEPRYIDMVSHCLRCDSGFGVVPIRHGHEVGTPATSYDTGTLATIVDWNQDADGLLGIVAGGSRRFRVLERSIEPDDLIIAEVRWLPVVEDAEIPERFRHLADLLREAGAPRGSPPTTDSALALAHRLAEALPLSLAAKVALLECDDALEKLERLDRYVGELLA